MDKASLMLAIKADKLPMLSINLHNSLECLTCNHGTKYRDIDVVETSLEVKMLSNRRTITADWG